MSAFSEHALLETGPIHGSIYAAKTHSVNFYVWKTGSGVVLFDTGFDRVAVRHALRVIGFEPSAVTHIFLTHSDIDHVGGLSLFPQAQVFLSADEEPMILHQQPRMGLVLNPRIRRPYQLLHDGDIVEADGISIRAIAASGHTPGSMCYLANGIALFSGDAFMLRKGEMDTTPRYGMDIPRQRESIRMLASFKGVELIFTGHWGMSQSFTDAFDKVQAQKVL